MPEPYLSGYYNPGTNSAAFPLSYPTAFNQPAAWSTGANTQPQSYEHAPFGYGGGLSGPSQASVENQQYVAADHLFSQSSPYQSTFAPYLNGGMGNWSYFNSANSFFFPTGNGDLNLSWGAAEALQDSNAAFLQDIYKPSEQEKGKVECFVNEMVSGFENADVNSTESLEHGLSDLNVADSKDTESVVDASHNSDNALLNSVSNSGSIKSSQVDPVSIAPGYSGNSNAPAKPVSWAAVASQPAKNKSPPRKSSPKLSSQGTASVSKTGHSAQNGAVTCQEGSKTSQSKHPQQPQQNGRITKQSGTLSDTVARDNDSHLDVNNLKDDSPLLKKLMAKFNFNPREFKLNLSNCRFFIIKSYSEDDIFRSIKYSSWTSTEHGNRRLNECYKDAQRGKKGSVYLLFSVNSSGHFCGIAEMMSEVDFNVETGIWVQDKWKGRFDVRWIYVKDVPNNSLRHIRLENNENKPVTNSRDTQEVPFEKGKQIVKIIHNYKAQTSIFDDFSHYEKRQEEDAKLRVSSFGTNFSCHF